jgi:hypothetical protein
MAQFEKSVEVGRTPWGLWWSLIAGFVGWFFDLGLSYLLEQHSCSTGHRYVLHVISAVCFIIALSGFVTGYADFKHFREDTSEEGGSRFNRAYFQAMLGMAFSVSFAVVIIAGAVPRWILTPCD